MNLSRARRLLLRPLTFAAAIATLLVWVSGFFFAELRVWDYGPDHVLTIGTSGRSLCLKRMDYKSQDTDYVANMTRWGYKVTPSVRWSTRTWFVAGWLGPSVRWEWAWGPAFARQTYGWVFVLPWWNVAAASLLLLAIIQFLHGRRHCRYCGYDLRGLPSNVCPECGRTFRR